MLPFLPVLGAIGGAVINGITSAGNSRRQIAAAERGAKETRKEAEKTRKFNAAEARAADARAEKMLLRAEARADERADPATVRRKMEEAGFNPLLATGLGAPAGGVSAPGANTGYDPGGGTGVGEILADAYHTAPMMGSTIASATSQMAEMLDMQRAEKAMLQMENQRLAEMAEQQTLRPVVPGIYGPRDGNSYTPTAGAGGYPAVVGDINSPAPPLVTRRELADPIADLEADPQRYVTPDGSGWISANPGAAERGEADYGEIGGELVGIDNLAGDAWGNQFRHHFDPEWGWEWQWPKAPPPRPQYLTGYDGWFDNKFGSGWMNEKFAN